MEHATQPANRKRPSASGRWLARLSYLLIAVAGLLPRVWDLGRFVTFDEANFWLARSELFLRAITTGDLAATAITVHPGVTTMWLGSAGIVLRRALLGWGWLSGASFATRLALMQLPVALAHSAGVLLGYWLLRRCLSAPVALLGALLWACDPFVIGYSRLLHVDALAGTFITLSLLAAWCYWHAGASASLLALSALCAGLAVLSKSPAAALIPVAGLIALASERYAPAEHQRAGGWLGTALRMRRAAPALLAWAALALLTIAVLWPALLVDPQRVVALIRLGVEGEGAQPHQLGNFFLGREYSTDAPGLLYYPVALALRTTPWTLAGLLLLPLALRGSGWPARGLLVALAGWVVLFTSVMSLFPKKFERYLEPTFPAVDILAAAGLYAAFLALAQTRRRRPAGERRSAAAPAVLAGLVAAAAIANVLWWRPYEIGAFNQALGGARAGAATFVVGWGEGLEQAAGWLNQQPDITGVTVAALRTEPLQAYLRPGAQAVSPPADAFSEQTGYVVVYLPDVPAGVALPPFDRFFRRASPAHEVVIHGVTYAWIYQTPPAVAHPRSADFGDAIQLRGFALDAPAQPGKTLNFSLSWATRAKAPGALALFVHVFGADGKRYAQIDPLLPADQSGPNRYFTTRLALDLPPEIAPGSYQMVIGVYDPASGQRLPIANAGASGDTPDGTEAIELTTFEVGQP